MIRAKHFLKFLWSHKIIVVILLLIAGLVSFFVSAKNQPKPVELATVQRQNIASTVSASGVISGKNSANLRFKISGKLASVNVSVGDNVQKGQLIAQLYSPDLIEALGQAQNNLRKTQATLDNTLDQLKGHDNDETFTQKQTRTTDEVARDNALEAVSDAQRNLADATITSPIDGIITSQTLVPGQIVNPTDIIAQVSDLSQIVFEADVDEADISKVSVGQTAKVALNAYGDKEFTGTVTEIIPQTKTASNGGTVVTVKIALDNQTIKPIDGLNGDVNIILQEQPNTLVLPQDAITADSMVVAKTPQGYSLKKVATGIFSDTDVEIKNGLNQGDQVVLNPNDFLKSHPNVK